MESKFKNLLDPDKVSQQAGRAARIKFRLGGIIRLISSILLLGLVIYAFIFPWKEVFPWYVGAIMIFLAAARLLVSILAYIKTSSFDDSLPASVEGGGAGRFAHSVESIAKAKTRYRLYWMIEGSLILIGLDILSFFAGLPWYVGAFLIGFLLILISSTIIEQKRVASVDVTQEVEEVEAEIEGDEVLIESIPGILRVLASGGTEFLGKGEVRHPENALLITNKAIWVLTVPLPGSGQMVAGTNISTWQWQTGYEDIRKGLEDLVASQPLDELLRKNRGKMLMRWEEIQTVDAQPSKHRLYLTRRDGVKFRYSLRQREDVERAKRVFGIP